MDGASEESEVRDPQGNVEFECDRVLRRLVAALPASHFLYHPLASQWVDRQSLVGFEFESDLLITSPKLPFVTQPPEWCDSQVFDAARLTLDLADECLEAGYELKDGSAWNVIYDGAAPIFCDHLSVAPLEGRLWWAAGQFSRHFTLPLLLSRRRGIAAHQQFRAWRDGVPPAVARSLLGASRYLTRYWPLMAEGNAAVAQASKPDAASNGDDRRFRQRLHASMRWMLDGVKPREDERSGAVWRGYVDDRPQYPGDSLTTKRECISGWLTRLNPGWVADLGCNTGEFTRMAVEAGARVIALDADHDSIDRLYRAHRGDRRIFPVLVPLDDIQGGRGWLGQEHPGLPARARQAVDLAMMLALVHHLAIAVAIPMAQVAALARHWTRQWLVVELLNPDDPQVRLLCAQRRRNPAEFSLASQLAAFVDAGFEVVEQRPLAPSARTMCLMKATV
jgi:SAM-dependent methyltransferase